MVRLFSNFWGDLNIDDMNLVWWHAWRTSRRLKLQIPWKLRVLPAGLILPIVLYWTTAGLTVSKGKNVLWAKLKFGLWFAGLLAEFVLHGYMEYRDWNTTSPINPKGSDIPPSVPSQPELPEASTRPPMLPTGGNQGWPEPRSNVNLRERLEGITGVILGEVGRLFELWG